MYTIYLSVASNTSRLYHRNKNSEVESTPYVKSDDFDTLTIGGVNTIGSAPPPLNAESHQFPISNIRLYNTNMTEAERNSEYDGKIPTNELLAFYSCQEGKGKVLHDSVGTNHIVSDEDLVFTTSHGDDFCLLFGGHYRNGVFTLGNVNGSGLTNISKGYLSPNTNIEPYNNQAAPKNVYKTLFDSFGGNDNIDMHTRQENCAFIQTGTRGEIGKVITCYPAPSGRELSRLKEYVRSYPNTHGKNLVQYTSPSGLIYEDDIERNQFVLKDYSNRVGDLTNYRAGAGAVFAKADASRQSTRIPT